MTPTLAIILGVFLLGAAARAVHAAVWGPTAVARRRLRAAGATLVDGSVVTLVGTVRALSTLEAPLSGAPCVAFLARGSVRRAAGDRNPDVFSTQVLVPFDLVTSSGDVRVEASTLELAHVPRSIVPRELDRETKFLVAHGFDARLVRFSTFEQALVVDGDAVRVHGLALVDQEAPDAAHGYREAKRRVRLVAHEAHPLTIGPA